VERQSTSAYITWDITWTLCNACNPTFFDWSGVPHAHVECAPCMSTLDRKCTLFKMIINFFLRCVVFWHYIVYIELLYSVTIFELVWTWNKGAVVENAKKCWLYPTFPYIGEVLNILCACGGFTYVSVIMWRRLSYLSDISTKPTGQSHLQQLVLLEELHLSSRSQL